MNELMGAQNFVQDANKRFSEILQGAQYPVQHLSDRWIKFAKLALRHVSISSLGAEPKKLRELYDYRKGEPLSLADFATFSNNMQHRSPLELGIFPPDYADLMEEVDANVVVWTELAQALRDDLDKELKEEAMVKQKLAEEQQKKNNKVKIIPMGEA